MNETPRVERLGDRGLILRLDGRTSRALTSRLAAIAIEAGRIEGVVDTAVGHRCVLVEIQQDSSGDIAAALTRIATSTAALPKSWGTTHQVSINYDGEDLDWVCRRLQMSAEELAEIHSSKIYDVKMLGSPGFIYLSPVDRRIRVPRLADPRVSVAEGSVGIGGRQTGIYGRPRPGGWRLIGGISEIPQTSAGDRIRFVQS